jgi:hypothetical protein
MEVLRKEVGSAGELRFFLEDLTRLESPLKMEQPKLALRPALVVRT